jgi:hypothetical protein
MCDAQVVHDTSNLASRLLDVLDMCPVPLKVEIIASIPEIVIPAEYE